MPLFRVCLSVSRECIIGTDPSLRRPLLIEAKHRSHAPTTDQRLHCSLHDRRCTRRDPRLIPNRDCTVRIYDSFSIHHNFGANTDQDPRSSLSIETTQLVLIRICTVRLSQHCTLETVQLVLIKVYTVRLGFS